jgi:hypothetical protein
MKLPDVELTTPAQRNPRRDVPETVDDIASGSPVILDPLVQRVRHEKRVALVINHLPETYKRLFAERAQEDGLTFKALLIDMMRHYGFEVPAANQIDGRHHG